MSHTAALPPVSRQAMSLLPSPLKSWELTVVSAQRAIWLVASSTNHSAPSGPIVMLVGALDGIRNSESKPAVVIRTILLEVGSVNHSAPSGPAVMSTGSPSAGNSVTTPAVVMRPILPAVGWAKRAPSGHHSATSGPGARPEARPRRRGAGGRGCNAAG